MIENVWQKCMTKCHTDINVWNVKKCTEIYYMYKLWNVQKYMKCTECHAWQKCMTENVWYTPNHRRYLGKII